ncbi:MAG: hypothetical protein FWF03_08940, partial [Defluviitaleaceae bacterium]|nr:hypothetical protein [Defluviitaleaceae bacterium]
MAREKQKTSGKRPVAEWMVTFSDMVTLIMTFFVLLFSMSNLDVRKIEALAESYAGRPVIFSGGFGDTLTDLGPGIIETTGGPETIDMEDPIVETGDSAPSDNVDPAAAAAAAAFQAGRDQMQAMTNTFRTYVAENYGENVILIDVPPASDHMVINFGDDMLFDSGSADIKIESYAIIDGVLDKLLEYRGHRIRVEGHTDNVPQRRPPFTSNRQLS